MTYLKYVNLMMKWKISRFVQFTIWQQKRIKSEINKSGDDAEKIKFLEARLKSLTEQMEYTLNKDDYDPKKFL